MKRLNGNKMRLAVVGIMAFVVLGGRRARADFTFGEPTNLGPTVNSAEYDESPCISADGLSLYFNSILPGGHGHFDIWVTTRETTDDEWAEPVNLGPRINTGYREQAPCISADGLELYFASNRGYGTVTFDIWVSTRENTDDEWGNPVKLGPNVNSSLVDYATSISSDHLSLFFGSDRGGGSGGADLWVTTRETINQSWKEPVNLGPTVNSSAHEGYPSISADGRTLFFSGWAMQFYRSGGYGNSDLWMTTRATTDDPWSEPVNLGQPVNSSGNEGSPNISADGSILYFLSDRPSGSGGLDLWQVSIEPVCDFNNDLKVDTADMYIMVDHWGENYPLCDIGPTPLGDGIIDIQDMIVLAEHLYRLSALWKLDETNGSIAYDSRGDHDGTVNGNPSWMPTGGIKDGSLMLDGIDDYIDTPFILDPSKGSFSVFAWVYSWMPGQVIISQKGESGGTWLGTNLSGKLMSGFGDGNFGALESGSFITDVQWHHVGFVYDTDTFHRILYVDGILVAEDETPVSGIPSDDGLYIGASKDLEAGTLFSGFIDDVCVYQQALTTEEIATLAQ